MNTKYLPLIGGALCLCLSFPIIAQDLNWYHRFEGAGQISVMTSLTVDTSDNLYTGGIFKGQVDFDLGPNTYLLDAGAREQLYVEKMRPDGSMVWAKTWGGPGLDTFEMVVGFDKFGNTYLEGRMTDSVDLDPGPGEYWMEPGINTGIFLLKLDPDGQFLWAIPQTHYSVPPVADKDGNIWLSVDFHGQFDADPGPGTFLLQGAVFATSNTAMIKLDPTGNFLWAGAIGKATPIASTIDIQGNFYLRATLGTGSTDVDPGPGTTLLTANGRDHFNLKLDPQGTLLWASHSARSLVGFAVLYFGGMEVNAAGEVFMSTQVIGKYDLDPGPGEHIVSADQNDILVMKLDAQGQLAWASFLRNSSFQTVLDLKLDAEDNSYVTGYLNKACDMDPGPGVVISPDDRGGGYDAYILKLDKDGAFNWVRRYGGKAGEWGEQIAVDSKGRITAIGPSGGIMDFGDLPGQDFIPASVNNTASFFLVQVTQDGRYSGAVYNDLNGNQLRDAGEPGVPGIVLRSDQRFTSTNADGNYRFTSDIGGDTLRPGQLRPYWNIEPAYALPDTAHLVNDFAFSQPDTVRDVALEVLSAGLFRPGFTGSVWLELHNIGNVLIDSVQVSLDSFSLHHALSFLSADPMPQIQAPGHLEWHLYSLEPGERIPLRVQFHTPDTVAFNSAIDFPVAAHLSGDLDESNNSRRVQTTVQGSFDPNDKQVIPEKLPESVAEEATLQYVIRFQNTGNYPAEFVILRDTLPATLDAASLEILGASHTFTWRLRDARILEIHFNQIQLPDSLSDPEGSQGFAAFRIRPVGGLQLGDSVINRAGIYFDYNAPVITAPAVTLLTNTSAVSAPAQSGDALKFQLSPNPARARSAWNLLLPEAHPGGRLVIYDLNGRVLLQQNIPPQAQHLRVPGLAAGCYTVQVQLGEWRGARLLLVE